MITWLQHDAYLKELKALHKTTRSIEKDIEKVKRLLVAHFYIEQTKGGVISPGKIHRITVDNDVTGRDLWKVEVIVPGLKPNHRARLWFMLDGEAVTFLAIASHKTNYDNNEIDRIAIERYRDILDL